MALSQRAERIEDYADADPADAVAGPVADVVAGPVADVVALTARREAMFTMLERQVIAVARHDPLGSLEAPGLIERLIAFLFGVEPAGRPLADPRLEAIRRAVVVAHHRHHLPDAIAAELHRIGYDAAQIRAIETMATAP